MAEKSSRDHEIPISPAWRGDATPSGAKEAVASFGRDPYRQAIVQAGSRHGSRDLRNVLCNSKNDTLEINGARYPVDIIESTDPDADQQLQDVHTFMIREYGIHPEEMVDAPTLKIVLEKSQLAFQCLEQGRYDALHPSMQPYCVLAVRHPQTNEIIAACIRAMLIGEVDHLDAPDVVPTTLFLSYAVVDPAYRGHGLWTRMTRKTVEYFEARGLKTYVTMGEATADDPIEASRNKLHGTSRLYLASTIDGKAQFRELQYYMPSQQFDVDGKPQQDVITSSHLIMGFGGQGLQGGVRGLEIKQRLWTVMQWVYMFDEDYYLGKQRAAGIPEDSLDMARAKAAVANNRHYAWHIWHRTCDQFGDDELVYPFTYKDREREPAKFSPAVLLSDQLGK